MLMNLIYGRGLGDITLSSVIVYIISALAVVFLTMPIHEFAHGFAAVKLGDNTPRWQGRLTLNPLAHIDYVGALCIILFGFGWAKPVQVDARNFKNPKTGMAITAFAGPLANIIVAFVSLVLVNIISLFPTSEILLYVISFLWYVASINVSLAVFNLIPIPPLDGSRLLAALLPYKQYYALMRYERYFFLAVLFLLFFGLLDGPLGFLHSGLMNLLSRLAALPFGFFR